MNSMAIAVTFVACRRRLTNDIFLTQQWRMIFGISSRSVVFLNDRICEVYFYSGNTKIRAVHDIM